MKKKTSEILDPVMNIRKNLKLISQKKSMIIHNEIKFSPHEFVDAYGDLINDISKNKEEYVDISVFDLKRMEVSIEKIMEFLKEISYSDFNPSSSDFSIFFSESYFLKQLLYRVVARKIDFLVINEKDSLNNNYKLASQELQDYVNLIMEKEIVVENIIDQIKDKKNKFESIESDILAKQSSINALEVNALSHATDINTTLSRSVEESEKINEILEKTKMTSLEIDSLKENIFDILENANKKGLSRSFENRRKEHSFAAIGWFIVF